MFGSHKPVDVLVVGAGPVGLFSAVLLAEHGLRVRVVDAERRIGAHSYALGLHPRSLQLLDEAGILGPILAEGRRIDTLAIYDERERRATLRLTELPVEHPYVIALRQDVLERLLEERLEHLRNRVHWNHRVVDWQTRDDHFVVAMQKLGKVSAGYAVALLESVIEGTEHLETRFIIGADGHRSLVRRQLEIPFQPAGATARFAVFEFATDAVLNAEACLVFRENDLNVLWPLPGGRCRWSFQIVDESDLTDSREKQRLAVQIQTAAYPALSEADLRTLLAERAPWFKGSIGPIDWAMAVQFERRLAGEFGRGRIRLAGDAAHMTWPAGMQSMNLGLSEAHALAGRIARIVRDTASDSLLDDYAAASRAEWRRLLGLDEELLSAPGTSQWLAANAGRLLPSIPASGAELPQLLRQVGLAFGAGAVSLT